MKARGLPAELPGHWMTPDGREMTARYAGMHRMEVMAQNKTDLEVANDVFLDPSIMNLTVAKDRIRWLSVQLALAADRVDQLQPESDMFRRAVEAAAVFQCGGPLAHLLSPGQSTVLDGPPAAAKRIAELEAAARDVIERYGFKSSQRAKEEDGCMVEAGNLLADLMQVKP
jgi:hypothetical protein